VSLNAQEGRIEIRYFAILNKRKDCGWLPMVTNNGHRLGDTYCSVGYSKEEAEEIALENAKREAEHYLGDWTITITKGEAK
jgi:hypothetical protein